MKLTFFCYPPYIFQRFRVNLRPNELWGPRPEVREKESRFTVGDDSIVVTNGEVEMISRDANGCKESNGENEKSRDLNSFDNPVFSTRL